MKKLRIVIIRKKHIYLTVQIICLLLASSLLIHFCFRNPHTNIYTDSYSRVIVIDAGHGGIDGGASVGNLLEKDINLEIAKGLKAQLEPNGYTVIMTREEDISLDSLSETGSSRHLRDLTARVNIINKSNAQLFISIHVNCNIRKPKTDGSIVFYSENFQQNIPLADSIQRALNSMTYNGKTRAIHDPQIANYFILDNSKIPGVLVETAFISNSAEQEFLANSKYRETLAKSIAYGILQYLKPNSVFY